MRFTFITLIFVFTFIKVSYGKGGVYTPMEIDNHPCTPRKLKSTTSYICDYKGNVICQSGWKQSSDPEEAKSNPCSIPICNHNNDTCAHGICRAPNFCACEVGWEGINCDVCIPLPGCGHGNCTMELECNCYEGWTGSKCDIPECIGCGNGECLEPNDCNCFSGWVGKTCNECIPMNGCVNGHCEKTPNTCVCNEGYGGVLCNEPVCKFSSPPPYHGTCVEGRNSIGRRSLGNSTNFCRCDNGWKGEDCNKCRPYWNCPNQEDNACNEPNECFCLEGSSKNNQICSKYVKDEKKSPAKIQNKLPKGEEKPGNRNQMDRSTRPIGPGLLSPAILSNSGAPDKQTRPVGVETLVEADASTTVDDQ